MRKTLIICFLTTLFSVQLVYAETVCRVVGVAKDDVLNMRKGSNTKTPIVATLLPNQTGILLNSCQMINKTNWCLVIHSQMEIQGWASSKYLSCEYIAP